VDACTGQWQVRRYLEYQGKKFTARFDAVTYMKLTQQMDSHDIGRGRGGCAAALACISARTLIMGMGSDVLYPLREQIALHAGIPGSAFKEITTREGHDGFLMEYGQVGSAIAAHLDTVHSTQYHGSGDIPRDSPPRARL